MQSRRSEMFEDFGGFGGVGGGLVRGLGDLRADMSYCVCLSK